MFLVTVNVQAYRTKIMSPPQYGYFFLFWHIIRFINQQTVIVATLL